MSTSTTNRPKVDISDREAAVDRYSRLSILRNLLIDLGGMCYRDPNFPSFTDESAVAKEHRRQLDWLGDLPEGFSVEATDCDPFEEQNALWEALWPAQDGNFEATPESEAADARAEVMTARLLLRIAEHPEWLRQVAMEYLGRASHLIGEAGAALSATQMFALERAEKAGTDA